MNIPVRKIFPIVLAVFVISLIDASLAFGQEALPESIDSIGAKVDELSQNYKSKTSKIFRRDAETLRENMSNFCTTSKINCTDEIELMRIGIKGTSGEPLMNIINNTWTSIGRKLTKKSTSLANKEKKYVEQIIRNQTPILIDYAGSKVPKDLVNLYTGVDLQQTVKTTTDDLNKLLLNGTITNTQVEGVLRDVFITANTDTGAFATGLMDKFSLQNVAKIILQNPKDTKALKEAVEKEIKEYAEQEMNKLANQAIGTMFPILQGVQLDFTNLNSKTLKSTLRSTIVNALAQSYLGPQYVAVYVAVSTVCPPCMAKTQAELRRFDKKYIQPGTEKIGEEWDRFEDRVKAESERVGKQIADELNRFKDRISAEFNRQKEQVSAIAKNTLETYQDQLKKAQETRVGKEIERELTDYYNTSSEAIDMASAELIREYKDLFKAEKVMTKQEIKVLTEFYTLQNEELKKLSAKTKKELKREIKTVSNAAQSAKEKVEAELKREADKVAAEAKRAADKVKAEANRLKKKAKKIKKKLKF